MTTYALITLRLASGEQVGPLNMFGSGGVLFNHQRIREYVDAQIRRANDGKPLWCYEPVPGQCRAIASCFGQAARTKMADALTCAGLWLLM